MPPPEWLIDGVFPAGGLIGLYGEPAAGKSFTTIDIAMSVATGRAWNGHDVKQGFVLYVSAEGGAGIGKRALAWLAHHEVDPREADIGWIVESIPVHVDSDEMQLLLDRVEVEIQREPSLIVVDTLARCFDGDENTQEDMGRFIAGVDKLRHHFRSAVLVVHHTRLGGDRERGNTAFRAAADTMVYVEKTDRFIEASCNKQKDSEDFDPISLELLPIEGTESCVVIPSNAVNRKAELLETMLEVLRVNGRMKWDAWMSAAGMNRSQFTTLYTTVLKPNQTVVRDDDGYWSLKGESGGGLKGPRHTP